MAKIEKISFEIETITPMFLAGADGKTAELRPASLKGLLRYWWRALQSESNLDELRKKEARIFGSSEEGIGGSSFSIRVAYNNELKRSTADFPKHTITVTSKSRGKSFPINILEYLAYGPCTYDKAKKRNVIVREYIQHGMKFTILINFFKEDYISEILQAIYVFELFGGLGSKSRNGFGSFFILNKEKCFAPMSGVYSVKDPYTKQNLQSLVKQTDSKSYTSFARGTKIYKAKDSYNTWDKALGEVGKVYRGIRSGDIKIIDVDRNQKTFEKHFEYDKRQYIGSPIIVDKDTKSFLERHAKPYFIKIAKEENQYRAYILYLPSRYCDKLDLDRNEIRINHSKVNNDFNSVCTEFNKYLASEMELVL